MARDYAAEYAARSERAQEYGFNSYAAERAYKEQNAELIELGRGEATGAYNAHEAYQAGVISDYGFEPGELDRDEWGQLAHELMGDFMQYYEDEAEALAAMHDLIGETP